MRGPEATCLVERSPVEGSSVDRAPARILHRPKAPSGRADIAS